MSRLLVIENGAADPLGRLGDWLVEAGLELDLRRAFDAAPLPDDLDGYAGLVVLGGPMSAGDDTAAPWLPKVRELLRAAIAAEVPTLGICLGAQLLALANGGTVGRNPDGPELGAQLVAKRSSAATDPLFRELPITPDVVQWHWDAVLTLPPAAIQLASSPGCEQQAFRVGRLAWGIQFHIEADPTVVRRWAAADAGALADYDLDRILARVEALDPDVVEVWRPWTLAFADVVRDPAAVPAPGGVPTATAAPITDPAQIRAALAAELTAARGGHGHGPGPASLPMPAMPSRRSAAEANEE